MLLPYNPWDRGTRRGDGDDAVLLDTLIAEVGADGFNGDTMSSISSEFYAESVNLKHPIALEPEGGGGGVTINWDTMGWGYWSYPRVPSIDRYEYASEYELLRDAIFHHTIHPSSSDTGEGGGSSLIGFT